MVRHPRVKTERRQCALRYKLRGWEIFIGTDIKSAIDRANSLIHINHVELTILIEIEIGGQFGIAVSGVEIVFVKGFPRIDLGGVLRIQMARGIQWKAPIIGLVGIACTAGTIGRESSAIDAVSAEGKFHIVTDAYPVVF